MSNQVLSCNRCSNVAEVYIPENDRVLCDHHFIIFKEAYSSLKFSSVNIDSSNVDAITEMLPSKQSTESTELSTGVQENHRVPFTLIIDHLGQLATGVEPATCKVCGKPMQLHAQFATTKQVQANFSGDAVSELQEATHPDFLANFADGGRGVCLACNGTGLQVIQNPSNIKDIYRHFNDDRHDQGHYRQLIDLISSLKGMSPETAKKGNLPFLITRLSNFDVNSDFDPSKLSEFPFSIAGYQQVDLRRDPHKTLHTLAHAFGEIQPIYLAGHAHPDVKSIEELYSLGDMPEEEAAKKIPSVFCSKCAGHGQHPLISHPDFAALLDEMNAKAEETSRDEQRRRKTVTEQFPGAVDLSTIKSTGKIAHAGPGIKPHDHHHKPHTYHKHNDGPGAAPSAPLSGESSGFSMNDMAPARNRNRSRGRGNPRYRIAPPKPTGIAGFLEKFKVEKWAYDIMNAAHDMTHTVYKNPSYMYRNPNPMYYSVPRSGWGMSKPWRN